jgi:PAS domain S-box-containing protein
MESISDGFFALDKDLSVTYFNAAASRLLGRKREEVLGRKLFDAFPEARGSVFEERYTQALQDRTAVAFETYFGGKPYVNWYDVRVFPFEEGISVFFQVITERKQTEQALLRSIEKYQLLSETADNLLAAESPQEIVKDLCRKVMAHLNCDVFFNFLVHQNLQRLHLNAFAGIPDEAAQEIEWLDYGVAVCGTAARDACRIIAEHIPKTPDPRTELIKSYGIKAYACHPLFARGRVIGTLSFGTRSRVTFTDDEISLMKTVSDQVALAMERQGLLLSVQERADQLETRVRERTADLQRATELLERVFSSIGVLIAYMDKDFNFIRVNRAYAESDGRPPEFYVGESHFALFPNVENEAIFRKVVETGEPFFAYQKPFGYAEHPERGITYWDWSLHPVKEPDGLVSGVVLTLIDVTERVQAQEKLRRKEELLRTTKDLLPVGLWITDKEGKIIESNPAGRWIWAGAKYVGIDQFREYKAWWADSGKLIEPEDWAVARAIKKGEASIDEELEIECFDGTRKIILNSAVPIRSDRQEITGVVVVNQDISDRKRKERLLKESEFRLHQLSSQLITVQENERQRISREIHDGIGQGLSAIKFRIEGILQQKGKWRDKEKSLEALVPLIRGCIEESRRVQMDLRPSMIDDLGILPTINWFCREFEKTYTGLHVEKRLSIQEQEVPHPLKIVIFRMLQEAMNNVAKHSKADRVDLDLGKVNDSVELVLQDNGAGFNLREVLSRSGLDRGLGLASMRERAELSGGTFTIDSTPGKGTRVRAAWPVDLRSAEPPA